MTISACKHSLGRMQEDGEANAVGFLLEMVMCSRWDLYNMLPLIPGDLFIPESGK